MPFCLNHDSLDLHDLLDFFVRICQDFFWIGGVKSCKSLNPMNRGSDNLTINKKMSKLILNSHFYSLNIFTL